MYPRLIPTLALAGLLLGGCATRYELTVMPRDSGKTYSGTLTVKSKAAVELSGCVAAIFCKTVTFTRVR